MRCSALEPNPASRRRARRDLTQRKETHDPLAPPDRLRRTGCSDLVQSLVRVLRHRWRRVPRPDRVGHHLDHREGDPMSTDTTPAGPLDLDETPDQIAMTPAAI